MYNFDPYILLAIATNIRMLPVTGFEVQGQFFFYPLLLFVILLVPRVSNNWLV